jgi:hypothetical protein
VIIEFLGRPPSSAEPELVEPVSPAGVDLDESSPTASVASSQAHDTAEANMRG